MLSYVSPFCLICRHGAGNPKWCSASPIRSLLAISSPPQRYTAKYFFEVQIDTDIPCKGVQHSSRILQQKYKYTQCKEMKHLIRLREWLNVKVRTNKKTEVQKDDLWLHKRERVQSVICHGLRLLGLDGR